ncbi:hypothetical protein CC79DRAFT_1336672 [Sarocladium strictum]
MCNNKPGAIPATNSIFTATLVLPSSGPGVVSFPPLTTTRTDFDDEVTTTTSSSSRRTTRTSTSEPTLETDTSEAPSTTAPEITSGFITSSRASSPAETTTSAGDDLIPDIPAGDDSDSDADGAGNGGDDGNGNGDSGGGLGTAQVAGISVGVAAAAGLALIAIFVARYYRRQRRLPELRSLFSKRDTWPYPEKDASNGNPDGSGSMAGVARQIEQPLDRGRGPGSKPPAYEGAAGFYSPSIGVAIASPREQQRAQNNEVPSQRPLSRLLPAKPVYVPGGARRNSPSPSEVFRDATMVSPALRRDGSPRNFTAQASQRQRSPNPLTLADTIQTRQSPSPVPQGAQQSPRRFPPTGPAAANAISPPQSTTSPLYNNTRSNINKPQPPIPPPLITNKLNAPPLVVLGRDSAVTEFEEDGGISARSTGLSTHSRQGGNGRAEGQTWVPPSTYQSGLSYYFSEQNDGADSRKPQPVQQQQQPRRQYQTTNGQDHIHPALRTGPSTTLAPAAEISRSSEYQSGLPNQPRSSSIYSPTIPRPLFSGPRRTSMSNGKNNKAQPHRSSDDSGVTQFSAGELDVPPLPGTLSPVAESPPEATPRGGAYPGSSSFAANNQPSTGDRRNPNNLRLAAGPPRSMRPYHPPGQPSPTLGHMHLPVDQPQDGPPTPTTATAPSTSRYQNPYSRAFYGQPQTQPSTLRAVSPSPPPDRDLLPSANPRNNDIISPLSPVGKPTNFPPSTSGPWRPPRLNNNASQTPTSPTSSANTTSSSLLLKRLGPVRAADMSFPNVRPLSTQRRWHQQDAIKSPHQKRPQNNGLLSPATPGQQPGTPAWVPTLTPTRRGDDLFLDVQ